ncbi:hypothetical protein RUR49_26165 [Pseudoxanthobacter sp. M-2]|uniref:hypothetical protein n=1 Tax=Pseudoxanthobacter sp. M-2 TaxID=3078754 RepID=UPI0038FD2403
MDERVDDPRVVRVAEAMVRARHGAHNAKVIMPKEEAPPRHGVIYQKHPPHPEWRVALTEARVFVAALDAAQG